ncbi:MAG: heavy metal translocating P-type ATPase metal-binding domain-containing protein [Verrucomicrobia bacterium]|nr:heavy metal translocating P-type ATPase metal-binding domain-containing protein [Verrucomicrobiota bacterium]
MQSATDTTSAGSQAPAGRQTQPGERAACFHCGELCPDDTFAEAEKVFCCQGCLIVHDLLTQSGLGHFYDLGQTPGVKVRRAAKQEQWAFLDEAELQRRLLDFTDGKISKVTFRIPAIHCVACVWLLENLFRLHPGVGRSQVNFPKREVAITFSPEQLKLSELVALLASIGYEPALTLGELEKRKFNPARRRQWLQVGLAGFGFGNIMLLSLPLYLGLDSFNGPVLQRVFGYLSLAFALPVMVFSAGDYWKSALLSLRQKVLTLDVPIALGLAALYAQSAFEILTARGEGYLDSLAGLVFFLLCGRLFQQKTHDRLAFDRDYRSFFPLSVTRLRSSRREEAPSSSAECGTRNRESSQSLLTSAATEAKEECVSISQLQVGDRLVIRNRELIPADAKLLGGPAFIDYSFVTGESEPVAKAEGDYLYAGGQQVGGAIEVETVKPVSQGYLTSLWNHEAFQKVRDDNLNTLTNRYSRRFTFIVIAMALGAAVFWVATGNPARALKAFTSVLIVACPCALALAAPFTLGTAQRLLARLNVFLKNALVLERLAQVNAIVFDKTGTLTATGANAVAFVGDGSNRSDQTDLSNAEATWLCSLTRHSTHPHSVRISEALADRHFPEPVRSFLETPGCGIEGQVQGREIWVGNQKWLEGRGVKVGPAPRLSSEAEDGDRRDFCPTGGSVVHVAINGRYRGAFVLSSTLRPEADRLIRELGGRYEMALLSGDNERERERFQSLFGDDARLHFNQSPLDKLGFIRRLQDAGKTVMMVGDGLNDAGALKQSDVGVAVVEKVGAFSPASDVILEAAQVPRLAAMLAFARRAAWTVRLGFAVSALYNLAGVSIAAAGVLSPLICAVLMPLSSVTVVALACGMTQWMGRRSGVIFDLEPISKRAT